MSLRQDTDKLNPAACCIVNRMRFISTTICEIVVPSPSRSGLTATEDSRCTTGCTSKTKKARRSPSKAVADTTPAAAVEAGEGGFAKALLMIALLPLSDAEKADAVRRLMAEQATGPVCGR